MPYFQEMALIRSISGIRGTIGGVQGNGLTPQDVVLYASAYGRMLKENNASTDLKVVIGRDARVSGNMISKLVCGTLLGIGINVIDLGLSTTPTVEVAVIGENAQGGIILTASHNPFHWNALKLLNEKGEFISAAAGRKIIEYAESGKFDFVEAKDIGVVSTNSSWIDKHIKMILALPLTNREKISSKNYRIVVDAVNSTGGLCLPQLLKELGVSDVVELNCEPTGHFSHNPEPLPQNISGLIEKVKESNADLGIVVDPDVDRLAFVSNDGSYFGEEYTLVAIAEYVLSHTLGATVSNLSSSRALRDVTESKGGTYFASAVGEVNVVEKMKAANAVIGGEGNGGVIYPELHYGRDALVGIALFLSGLAERSCTASEWRNALPDYFMAKKKIELTPEINVDQILKNVADNHINDDVNTIDGVKIDFADGWVHLRKSNTEPIIRVYSESTSKKQAEDLAEGIMKEIYEIANQEA